MRPNTNNAQFNVFFGYFYYFSRSKCIFFEALRDVFMSSKYLVILFQSISMESPRRSVTTAMGASTMVAPRPDLRQCAGGPPPASVAWS